MAAADRTSDSLVILTRPRGYFDASRDQISLDGKSDIPGVVKGVSAGNSTARIKMPEQPQRSVAAEFNGEKLRGLNWPASQNHVTVLELTY